MCSVVAALAGSTGLNILGKMRQGAAANAAGRFNAKIGEINAKRLEASAQDAVRRGGIEAERATEQGAQVLGTQRATLAARGVDANFGSPMDIILATAMAIELDRNTVMENSKREADDLSVAAFNARVGASMDRAEGRNAQTGAMLSSVGSLLDGGAAIYKYRTTGQL